MDLEMVDDNGFRSN